jgi:AmiR/NasT family two-component response regulator
MSEPEPSRRVLLAEDEAIIRLDLKEMLEEEGYEVVAEAGDGQSAVRLADELRPDVVVMDIKMPGLDGLSAAERISGTRIAPVLVLTAFGQRELVDRAAQAGAMGYLVKPFQKVDVVPAIELAVARYREAVALEREVEDLTERLETRILVDRARGVLMDRYGMAEADAFRFLQKTAMDRRLKMGEVARRVVDGEMEA